MDDSIDRGNVLAGVRSMLTLAGEDPDRPGLASTPLRFLAAWLEMTARPGDPATLLATSFGDAGPIDQMITVGPIPFSSNCEHHLLPFAGIAWIAYLPDARIVGLSKLPRLLQHFAHRPQIQERIAGQVTAALDEHVTGNGSACLLRATHTCATLRGVRTDAPLTTTSLTGAFRSDPSTREEFLAATRAS